MCPLPPSSVATDSLLDRRHNGKQTRCEATKMQVAIPFEMPELQKRPASTTSSSSSCTTLDSGSDLAALDDVIADKLGRALDAVARQGDFSESEPLVKLARAFEGPSGHAPSISVRSYIKRMLRYIDTGCGSSDWNTLCPGTRALLTALIYIDRLTTKTGLVMKTNRVHRLIATGMLVSLKMNEDALVNMKFFADLAGVKFAEMKKMEAAFLELIQWDTVISADEFKERISTWKRLVSSKAK